MTAWRVIERINGRARTWDCPTDARLTVQHCGHPTAHHPYFVRINGVSMYDAIGAFRTVAIAQAEAQILAHKIDAEQDDAGDDRLHTARRLLGLIP